MTCQCKLCLVGLLVSYLYTQANHVNSTNDYFKFSLNILFEFHGIIFPAFISRFEGVKLKCDLQVTNHLGDLCKWPAA